MTLDALDLARRWQDRCEKAEEQRDAAVALLRETKNALDHKHVSAPGAIAHVARVRLAIKKFLTGQRAAMQKGGTV